MGVVVCGVPSGARQAVRGGAACGGARRLAARAAAPTPAHAGAPGAGGVPAEEEGEAHVRRRGTLAALVAGAAAVGAGRPRAASAAPAPGATNSVALVTDGGREAFGSASEALAAAPDGAVIELGPGTFSERLVIEKPITVRGAPGEATTLEWTTKTPYESVIDVGCGGVRLEGLQLRHASKSVAQNYGVFVREAAELVMVDCAVTSSTGSGVGVEGGAARLEGCTLSGCKAHGAALYGDLLGSARDVALVNCVLEGNGGDGLLARQGARATLQRCELRRNRGAGAAAVDARLALEGCSATANRVGVRLEGLRARLDDRGANDLGEIVTKQA